MEHNDSRRSTLMLIMIVIFIGISITGITAIYYIQVDKPRRSNQCGRNQAQIMFSMIAYLTENNTPHWVPSELFSRYSGSDAAKGRLVTTNYFELLAAIDSLPNGLFHCYASSSGVISAKPKPFDSTSKWGQETGYWIGYTLDWSAPIEVGSSRPMLADRDLTAHRDAVMVVFGDGHSAKMKLVPIRKRAPGALLTDGIIVQPTKLGTGNQPDDDIYSNEGDGNDGLTPGAGDPLRAWVK
jgi:hypothetical protein